MQKKRKNLTTVIFGFIFLVGLSVMLYPTLANLWNNRHQQRQVTAYKEAVAEMDDSASLQMLEDAYAYNERLAKLNSQIGRAHV